MEDNGQQLVDHIIVVASEKDAQAPESEIRKSKRREKSRTNSPAPRSLADGCRTIEPRETIKSPSKLPTHSPTPMPAARALPLLICSIGNPGSSYANTLHSAGHTVLTRLAEYLGCAQFRKDRSMGNGLVSSTGDWSLWQSTSYMNESGKGVRTAHMHWLRSIDGEGKLVVIHDELEKPLGAITVRTSQGASARGHNGIKSILASVGKTPFARIGIGIGRPISREPDDVARYVLKKMTPAERQKIEGGAEEVLAELKQLERG